MKVEIDLPDNLYQFSVEEARLRGMAIDQFIADIVGSVWKCQQILLQHYPSDKKEQR